MQAQSSPPITWPEGVSAVFPTISGSVATVIANSVEVMSGNAYGDRVEVGWRLLAGANRFEPFSASVYSGVLTTYPGTRPAGNFTFTYTVRYRVATQCFDLVPCFDATATSGGTTWFNAQLDSPTFSTGTAVTNALRADSTDTFSTTPTFTSLQKLSSSTWSFWPAAECYFDFDPTYKNNYFTSPTKVTITTGSTC